MSGTTTPTDTISTSASSSAAGYVSALRYPVRSCVKNLLVSIIDMVFMLRSHKHIHNVRNLFVIAIFWIKLLLKLPKFQIESKPIHIFLDRQFFIKCVTGPGNSHVACIEPNSFSHSPFFYLPHQHIFAWL